ncbi:hypothetical protein M8J77_011455 [Diaphorina citri]|nr:hypothetical protein M8J77_011455 [Diaphorina citri]
MNGKGREIVDMMQKRRVDVLCIQETRWKGNKAKQLEEGYKIYYSGADARGRNGVGVILKRELVDNVCEVNRRNDRIMTMKLEVEGCPTRIVCVYAPQQGCEEEEKDNFWQELDQVMMEIPKEERIIAGGDFNGHVGRRGNDEERVHGGWSYGERNDGGDRIVEYALAFDLGITNTFFEKRDEHLITYKSGPHKSQIDYIMCRRNHLREVKNAKVINGDGVAAQHRLLVMDIEMEVKKTTSGKIQREQKIKWWMLKDVERRREFKQKVLEEIVQKENVQEWWDVNSNIIRRIESNVLGKTTGKGAPQKKET